MDKLDDVIRGCVEWVQRYGGSERPVGEENTKHALVEPVIEALGWERRDPNEVHREYRQQPSDDPVDYALLLKRTPRLLIEAKGLGEKLDTRSTNQTIKYAAIAGVKWVALTNGTRWQLYNAYAPVPAGQKLFRAVDLDDVEAALETLSLLGKDSIRDGRIDALWEAFCVDRQVHVALGELLNSTEPSQELVELVRQRTSEQTYDEVRASLIRLYATFEFPSVASPPLGTGSAAPKPPSAVPSHRGTRKRRSPRTKPVTEEEKALSLRDLRTAGRLSVGAKLEANYFGEQHAAELLDDCSVRYDGRTYDSLSGAGAAVKDAIRGPGLAQTVRATDGWLFWRTEDARTGEVVPLMELRRRAATDLVGKR